MNGKPLVSIVSAGLSKFGKNEGLYARELFAEAVKEAFDCYLRLEPKRDVKAMFVGHMGESYLFDIFLKLFGYTCVDGCFDAEQFNSANFFSSELTVRRRCRFQFVSSPA